MTTIASLTRAHARSRQHRAAVLESTSCACFHCLARFAPSEIREWTDDDQTALCPKCGIDAVLSTAPDLALTHAFLQRMQRRWFQARRSTSSAAT